MSRRLRYTLLTAILTITLSACGDTPAQAPQPTSTPNSPGPTTGAATSTTVTEATISTNPTSAANPTAVQGNQGGIDSRGSGNASVIDVVVTGGPYAGTYQRRSSQGTCSANLTGNGSWGNQYSDPDIKDSLSSLQLVVENTAEAANGTSNFLAIFAFGDYLSENSGAAKTYTFNGRGGGAGGAGGGKSGTVKVEDGGQSGKVTLQIEPEDGVKIDATIQCNEVIRGIAAEATRTSGPQDETARLSVTLAGGEPAGTFEATSTDEGTCSYGAEGGGDLMEGLDDPSDAFAIGYYKEGEKLNMFRLLVLKTKEASSGAGTQNFYLEISDQSYYMDNQTDAGADGTGTVKIQDNGNTATINFDATTKDGKTIKATIECRAVSR